MKLTKYAHACAVIENAGERLVIDPGGYSPDFTPPESDVVAIIITHVHPDHFDKNKLAGLLQKNPSAAVFTTEQVASQLPDQRNVTTPSAGQSFTVGSFELQFFGGQHATIFPDHPADQNIAVLINSSLYYPGDSFAIPEGAAVQTLLAPAAAPWMKISEAMDFIAAVKPSVLVVPTHDAILSETGQGLADTLLTPHAEASGATYRRLTSGESVDI